MATLKQRLLKKNSSGSYDTVHLETSATNVLMSNGTTVEAAINSKAASNHTHSNYAASTHTHTAAQVGALATNGTAAAATKLATARNVQVNLASTAAASFNGTANITPGVTGVLPVARGGTGVATEAALIAKVGTLRYWGAGGYCLPYNKETDLSSFIDASGYAPSPKCLIITIAVSLSPGMLDMQPIGPLEYAGNYEDTCPIFGVDPNASSLTIYSGVLKVKFFPYAGVGTVDPGTTFKVNPVVINKYVNNSKTALTGECYIHMAFLY